MIYVRDMSKRIVAANAQFLRCFDLAADRLPLSVPEEYKAKGWESILDGDTEVLQNGQPILLRECRVTLGNGEENWLWISKIPLFSDNRQMSGLVCTIQDIGGFKTMESSLQKKENLFRTLAERSFSAIFIAQGLRIQYINPIFQNCFSIPPDTAPDSISLLDLFSPEDAAKLKKKCLAIEEEGLDTSRFLLSAKRSAKGSPMIFEGYLTEINYFDKPAVLGSLLDITDKYLSSLALEAKAREYEELNLQLEQRIEQELKKRRQDEDLLLHQSRLAAMGEMIGAIAHQWRQPLTTLSIQIQNLWNSYKFSGIDEQTIRTFIEASHLHITRMTESIDQFSRFFASKTPPAPPETMGDLLQDSIVIFSGSFPEPQISLDLSPELKTEKWAGQTNAFKQVMISLLSLTNPRVSTPSAARKEILLSARKTRNRVRIILALPLDPEQKEEEPRPGHRAITVDMCRKLVTEHMQGKFQVRQDPPRTLEFYIELPVK